MNIVCVGDCGIDKYSDGIIRPGGITLNFAVHARTLFPHTDSITIISALGTDKEAKIVQDVIDNKGIYSYITRLTGKTPQQAIEVKKDGEKKFTHYWEGVLANFIPDKKQLDLIQEADFIIIPIFSQIYHLFNIVINSKKNGITAIDFMDLSDFNHNTDIVEKYIDYFDIGFFGLKKSEKGLISSLQNIAKEKKKLFVITLGKNGSIAYTSEKFFAPGKQVQSVVDTTGAGDAFAAAFINTYLRSKDIEKSLQDGNNYASHIILKKGSFLL